MRHLSFFGLAVLAMLTAACSGGVAPVEVVGQGPDGSESPGPSVGKGAGKAKPPSSGSNAVDSSSGSASGGVSSSSSSSTTSGAAACTHCVESLIGAPGSLCSASQEKYSALESCACASGTCSDCTSDYCTGSKPSSACLSCMAMNCMSAYQACGTDSM